MAHRRPVRCPDSLAAGGGIFLSVFLLEWAGRNIFSRINTSVACSMRQALLGGMLSRDLGAFKQETVGSYVSQLTNDITAIQNEFLTPLYNIVLYGGMLLFSLFFLYRIHPLMFLIAVAMAVFPAVIPHIFARHLKKSRGAFSKENAAYVTVSKDILQGFETLRSFGGEENAARQHHASANALARSELRYNQVINCNIATTSFIGQVVFYLVLAIGIVLVFRGDLSIGYLVTATNLINFTNQPVQIISQSPFLFNGTVLENITLFCDKWTEAEVLSAARQAGLGDLLAALPLGLHSEILENSLSGGQAQRIGIARAVLRKPAVLLADEPTANLDSALADDIESLLMDWPGTAILITHRKSELVLSRADGILEFAKGSILPQ